VEYLKQLYATKGSRNVLKRLGYNKVNAQEVEYLSPAFNIVFELPPLGTSSRQSQGKLMQGMDKRHDGHT
jgi:hypothetical protein